MRRFERDLRSWLRLIWGEPLFWIEPARGGNVGLADVILLHRGYFHPVELKVATRTRNGLKAQIRPSQIRFHYRCAAGGGRTAILFLVENEVFFLAGKYCPRKGQKALIDEDKLVLIGHLNRNRDKAASNTLEACLDCLP